MQPNRNNGEAGGEQPPPDEQTPDLRAPHRVAAGLPAVTESLKFAARESGLVRGIGTWLRVNKKDGFDCQSCAWPSPDEERNVFEFCESGAKALASETTKKRITAEFFRKHSIVDLQSRTDFWLEKQGRLTAPMVARGTHYEPISWEEAFALMARELNALPTPNAAAFYTSGRTSNEAAFLYQLFARQFGTNNLPDCSNMCHESSGSALSESIGIGKGCVKLEDFEKADTILIIGQNPGTNHPRMLTTLERAKKNGATIVALNPLPEPGLMQVVNPNPQTYDHLLSYPVKMLLNRATPLSDLWLPVRINGDMAALRGVMKEMLMEEERAPGTVIDREFIETYSIGFDSFVLHLNATSWESILQSSGLTREQIAAAAKIAGRSKRMICCWAMGLTQHEDAVATIQEVMNLLLLGGHIGRPGAGPCPVRGHSNVQGDRTMGIWERMGESFLSRLEQVCHFTSPREHGVDVVEAIRQMHAGKISFFLGLGGNFLAAAPDTEYTAAALRQCRLTAHISTKLNRSHLVKGEIGLILPCLGRSEIDQQQSGPQFVTVEDSMGIINPSRGYLRPASDELLSEPAIVAGLAKATLGTRGATDWDELVANYDRIRDRIEQVIPGFDNFNQRIREDIFYLPNDARDKRKFNNKEGKAKFTCSEFKRKDLAEDEYLLMTIRSHDQFNTTIYGLNDRYRGVFNGRRVVFMNGDDMTKAGLVQGQFVDLVSNYEGVERVGKQFMVAPFTIPHGCTASYFPEANVVVPITRAAAGSNSPISKSVVIRIRPSAEIDGAVSRLRAEAAEAN